MRTLPIELSEIGLGNSESRDPRIRIEVFDFRTSGDTINDVVSGSALSSDTGPLAVQSLIRKGSIKEKAGDYVATTVATKEVEFTLIDQDGQLDPFLMTESPLPDPAPDARFFRQGNGVRVYEGDASVDPAFWPLTFTGLIVGQPGYASGIPYTDGRAGVRSARKSELTFRAYGRESQYLTFRRTSDVFESGDTYTEVAIEIAEAEMGLGPAEHQTDAIENINLGSQTVRHESVQLADEPPMVMLAKVMFAAGFSPAFNGDGVLTQTGIDITDQIDRFYETNRPFLSIDWPLSTENPPDVVTVERLDFNLSKVKQPIQVLARVTLTTGYFTDDDEVFVYWSDDHTLLAEDISMRVIQSVTGGMSFDGSDDLDRTLPAPVGTSTIGAVLVIGTGYAPWILVFLAASYVGLAFVPDLFVGLFSGVTIPIGRIAQAIALAAALIIMTKLGRGEYEFVGAPVEWVFKTIRRSAMTNTASEFSRNEVQIQNHLVVTETDAADLARDVLFRQQSRRHPRNVQMLVDLALEPDDVFYLLAEDRRFYVDSIQRTYTPDARRKAIATLGCLELSTNITLTA